MAGAADVSAAVRALPGGERVDAAKEIAEAAGIIAASSAVPIVGTAGGVVIAAVKILGPRVFKAITGLFSGRENPWPDRVSRAVRSSAPALERVAALDALRVLASSRTTSKNSDTARWARGGVSRARAGMMGVGAAVVPDATLAAWQAAMPAWVQSHAASNADLRGVVGRAAGVVAAEVQRRAARPAARPAPVSAVSRPAPVSAVSLDAALAAARAGRLRSDRAGSITTTLLAWAVSRGRVGRGAAPVGLPGRVYWVVA